MADELESKTHFEKNIPTSYATWKHKFESCLRLKGVANLFSGTKQTVHNVKQVLLYAGVLQFPEISKSKLN
jgi:hypothetical protein